MHHAWRALWLSLSYCSDPNFLSLFNPSWHRRPHKTQHQCQNRATLSQRRVGVPVCVFLRFILFLLSFLCFMQRIAEYSSIYQVSTSTLLEMHCLSIFLKCWNNSVLILCKIGLLPLNWSDNNTPVSSVSLKSCLYPWCRWQTKDCLWESCMSPLNWKRPEIPKSHFW